MPVENIFNEEGKINLESLGENHVEAIKSYVNTNYRNFIPKEIAEDGVTANIGDLETLAKSYKNAQTAIAKKGVILPTENDDEEAWNKFYSQLGRPSKSTEYEYDKSEGFDNEEFMQKFSEVAHKQGLNNKQAKSAMKFIQDEFLGQQNNINNAYKERIEKEWGDVQKEFGQSFTDKQKKVNALLMKFADDDIRTWIKDSGIGGEAKLFKFLASVADSVSEDTIGNFNTAPAVYGPKEAMSKANDIMSNKNNALHEAYLQREHPRHKEAVSEVERLFKMAYSDK